MTPKQIKKIRNDLGETLEQFAKRFAVKRAAVGHWETGHTTPRGLALRELIRLRHEQAKGRGR